MDGPQPAKPAGYPVAWLIVVASTIASGMLACLSMMLAYAVAAPGTSFAGAVGLLNGALVWLFLGGLVAAPVGLVSATICAFTLKHEPARRVVTLVLIPSVVVGVVSAPVVHVFSAALVFLTQIVVAQLARVPERDDDDPHCDTCGYSLVGLDRTTSPVCPECGGPIV